MGQSEKHPRGWRAPTFLCGFLVLLIAGFWLHGRAAIPAIPKILGDSNNLNVSAIQQIRTLW